MHEDIYHLGIKALITDKNGKVLLLKVNPAKLKGAKNSDYWDLPGGRVQRDSTIEETLRREVAEEIGVTGVTDAKPVGMVLSNIRIPQGNNQSVGLILGVYACAIPESADIRLSTEHIAFKWWRAQEAADLLRVKYPQEFCELVARL